MEEIKKCHESIIKIYREIKKDLFLIHSLFGEVTICKEQILKNSDKPFNK